MGKWSLIREEFGLRAILKENLEVSDAVPVLKQKYLVETLVYWSV